MKKRILSIFICLCMAKSLLPISAMAANYNCWDEATAGGVTLNEGDTITIDSVTYTYSGNKSDGLDLNSNTPIQNTCYKAGEGYAVFTPKTDTENAKLLLNGTTISTTNSTALVLPSDAPVDITITGDNSLTAGGSGNVIYTNSQALTVTGDGNITLAGSYYGINVNGMGAVSIDITGNITFQTSSQPISTSGDITITAKSITAKSSYNFYGGAVSLTATDGDISLTTKNSYNGAVYGQSITLTANKGAITIQHSDNASGGYAIIGTTVTISALNDIAIQTSRGGIYASTGAVSVTSQTGNILMDCVMEQCVSANGAVTLNAAKDITLNESGDSSTTISAWQQAVDITTGGKLTSTSAYGYQVGILNIKANEVSITGTIQDAIQTNDVTITNPNGGNCKSVSIVTTSGDIVRAAISSFGNVTIKADDLLICSNNSAKAINSTGDDKTITIGDAGLIIGTISIGGTNAISTGILRADKNGGDASGGLNLATNTPTQSTYYKAGDGYVIFIPASGDTPATLILNNAEIYNTNEAIGPIEPQHEGIALPLGNITIKVKGTNSIISAHSNAIGYIGIDITLTGDGTLWVYGAYPEDIYLNDGSFTLANDANVTLNGVVVVRDSEISQTTVYGDVTANRENYKLIGNVIIANDAVLTVPEGEKLLLNDTGSIAIYGQIVNEGTIILPYDYTVEKIQALNLNGNILLYDNNVDKYKIYINGAIYAYGGELKNALDLSTPPIETTCYKTDTGYLIFTPANGETQATLTMHELYFSEIITFPNVPITLYLEGENDIRGIDASNSVTVTGSGTLDIFFFHNSNSSAALNVNSGATMNTMYVTKTGNTNTSTIYGNYNIQDTYSFGAGSGTYSLKLVFTPGSVLTLKSSDTLIVGDFSYLSIGEGASIVNNGYVTLPKGTTTEQIKELPLSGAGIVRVATAYDESGVATAWDSYNNNGDAVSVIDGGDLILTTTEVPASENIGYTWIKSGEGDSEVWTLSMSSNSYIDGRIEFPDKTVVVNCNGNNIVSDSITMGGSYACNITFTGAGSLTVGGSISGSQGGIMTLTDGVNLTVNNSVNIGSSGGTGGTLNVIGEGTELNVSSSHGYAVFLATVNVEKGATLTAKAPSVGVAALSGGVNVTEGSTLTTSCEYGVYITDGKLNVDDSSKLITNGSIAPFCIEIDTNISQENALSLPGLPAGTEITFAQGEDDGYGNIHKYWSLVSTGGSLDVTDENNDFVTLIGAITGQLSFVKAESKKRSSGGSGSVSYTLTFETNGGSTIDKITKVIGTTVDLSTYNTTQDGYDFDSWYSDMELTEKVTNVKLMKNTTVYAKWTEKKSQSENPFDDVSDSDYYHDAVIWAVEKGITNGTNGSSFSPDMICTRAQAVTFLWRAMGSPEPTSTVCPFVDVLQDAYYYKAVLWAVEKGITKGTSSTAFSPDETVTRGQTMTFLWRTVGEPKADFENPFTDVTKDDYYYDAVLWALEKGVTQGTSDVAFSSSNPCSRSQIVTFLYRYMGKL